MKRLIYFTTSIVVLVSLTACSPRNTSLNNGYNNTGTNQGSAAGQNNTTVSYWDGVYTGKGDGHANGNELATVTVRNGKIVNVVLATVDPQGKVVGSSGGVAPNGTNERDGNIGSGAAYGNGSTDNPNRNTGSAAGTGQTGNTVNSATDNKYNNTTNTTNSGTTVSSTLEYLGARLSAAMILNQTNDVAIDGIDGNFVDTANNWKLAAKRALDQAR